MTDKLPNPQRGCGTLKRGKVYLRGLRGEGRGVLPSWVRIDPPIPFKEIGTEGSFTRSYKKIDGLSLQLATTATHDYIPKSPGGEYPDKAFDMMVEHGVYETKMEIPEREVDRHIDRIKFRSLLPGDDPQSIGGHDWGRMPVAEQTDLLMRAGESYYPEPDDFAEEARDHGLSKAIPVSPTRDPPTVVAGLTRCWVMHPAAGDDDFGGAVIGYAYLGDPVFTEPEDGDVPQYVEEHEQNGRLRVMDIEEPPEDDDEEDQQNMTLDDAINGGDDDDE